MSTNDTAPPVVTPEARKLQMLDLWAATATNLLARLQGPEADSLSASFMDTIVGFLQDSAINVDTIIEAKEALDDITADLIKQIAEIKAEEDTPAKAPTKAPKSAVVVPLNAPFEPRPPRT